MTATAYVHIAAKLQNAHAVLESIKQPAADNTGKQKFSE
jgi:hypothetical protein